MKFIFILMTVLNSLFYLLDAQTTSKKELVDFTAETQKTDSVNRIENKLIGEWDINVYTYKTTKKKKRTTINETTSTVCNSCPRVTFNDSMTATINYPIDSENIKWKTTDNKLIIINIDKNSNRAFPDSIYEMTYTQIDNSMELELKQKNNNYSIILRRQK